MAHSTLDMAALLGSRICHDLISPLGAIGNGLELLEMSGASKGPELSLISDSVSSANARIRLFRIAFGEAGHGASLGRAEIVRIIDDTYRGTRLGVVWGPPGELPRREVKIALLCVMCLESALPYGGEIQVARADGHWTVTAEAEKMKVDPALWDVLGDPVAPMPLTPGDVHFGLLRDCTSARRPALEISRLDGGLALRF